MCACRHAWNLGSKLQQPECDDLPIDGDRGTGPRRICGKRLLLLIGRGPRGHDSEPGKPKADGSSHESSGPQQQLVAAEFLEVDLDKFAQASDSSAGEPTQVQAQEGDEARSASESEWVDARGRTFEQRRAEENRRLEKVAAKKNLEFQKEYDRGCADARQFATDQLEEIKNVLYEMQATVKHVSHENEKLQAATSVAFKRGMAFAHLPESDQVHTHEHVEQLAGSEDESGLF